MYRFTAILSTLSLFCFLLFFTPACSAPPGTGGDLKDGGTTDKEPPKRTGPKIKRRWTYRIITGFSMGGAMSSIIGTRNHEKFDIIGTLGAPNAFLYMMHHLRRGMFGGFCSLKELEDAAKNGKLDSKEGYCPKNSKPAEYEFEFTSDYNNWKFGGGAGGSWSRNSLVKVFQDIFLALGNPGYYNEKSPYWPHPSIPKDRRANKERCKKSIKIKGFKHDLYNPEGKYDVITFCDGGRDGIYDPKRRGEHQPIEVLLAVDINGNGVRDYGEPVIFTPHERYDDVGKDGCANDKEDGKGGCLKTSNGKKEDANGDDYDPLKNPTGTEGNLSFDEGEPYKDFGLDGIENTKDFGEGDGKFTVTPNWTNIMAHDPATLVTKFKQEELNRLNIFIDGGIRDLFNFHITGLHLYGKIKSRYAKDPKRVQLFDRFISLMKTKNAKSFDFADVDWSEKGQHVYVRYGDPKATEKQIQQGDGDHVHGGKVLDRLLAFMGFVTYHLPKPDLDEAVADDSKKEGHPLHFVYESKALKRKNMYTVVLPPGFHAEKNKKYPVLYIGHGYGMSGPDMASLFAAMMPLMSQGTIAKMIMVSIHGSCEQWLPKPNNPRSFHRARYDACRTGTFYVNGKGLNNDGPQMEKAFFEVVNEIETKYKDRIRQPETLDYYLPVPSK